MLKGHVFTEQIFESEVFAYFIDTFLSKKCGIGDYGSKMQISHSGNNVTIQDGLACVRGRFIEEDSSATLNAGTDNAFCKLVIEVDLDKENTEEQLNQVSYKIVKSTSAYPNLTQTDIVKNNSGIYQYELARFKTSTSGITNFQDMRTFIDFNSIYKAIETEWKKVLEELKAELATVEDESAYFLNKNLHTYYIRATGNELQLPYPSGFNMQNSHIISVKRRISHQKGDGWCEAINHDNVEILYLENYIDVSSNYYNGEYMIILMKKDISPSA